MKQWKWKRRLSFMLVITLAVTLVIPIRSTVWAADGTGPELVRPSVMKDAISLFFTRDLFASKGSFTDQDFEVKVNGEPVKVWSVSPLFESNHITFSFLFIDRQVVKGDQVTARYTNMSDPIGDDQGNPLSTAEVEVNNITPGTFLTTPILELPDKVGYKLKANDPIVTFTPTSGNANRVQFRFPGDELNASWLESNDKLHQKSDYIIYNNTDHTSYSPRVMFLNAGLSMVDFILPEGIYMQEGKSYTLAMSSTVIGTKVRLPARATATSQANIILFRDAMDGLGIIDDYTFSPLKFIEYPNQPPVAVTGKVAQFQRGDMPYMFQPGQLATDEDEDDLTLSNPSSDDMSIATAVVESNILQVNPAGAGTTHVRVDVSDDHQHTVTVTLEVIVKKPQTPMIAPQNIQIVKKDGTYTVSIAEVAGSAEVRVYDAAAGGNLLGKKIQRDEPGSLIISLDAEILSEQVYVTQTDHAADKAESERTSVTLPHDDYTARLSAAVRAAEQLYYDAEKGDQEGQYPADAMASLRSAIDVAAAVLDNNEAAQSEVETAVTVLNLAVDVFKSKQVHIDKTLLSTAITSAQTLHDSAVEGTSLGQYKAGAKTALQTSINAAKTVLSDAEVTQKKVDAAVTALNQGVKTFNENKFTSSGGEDGGQGSGGSSGSSSDNLSNAGSQQQLTAILVVIDGKIYTVYMERGRDAAGQVKDRLEITKDVAAKLAPLLKAAGLDKLRLVIPDASQSAELNVTIPQDAASILADNGQAFKLVWQDAEIGIPIRTLRDSKQPIPLKISRVQVKSNGTTDADSKKNGGTTNYAFDLPAAFLSENPNFVIEVNTPDASVDLNGQMFKKSELGKQMRFIVSEGDRKPLSKAVQAQVGNRPVVQLSVQMDGKSVAWKNEKASALVRVPYELVGKEMASGIGILSIDDQGVATVVKDAAYSAADKQLRFQANQDGIYAVFYVQPAASFADLSKHAWAQEAIDQLTSLGVVQGTSATTFSPAEQVSRADFVVMLVRALNLKAGAGTAFTDVDAQAYYYDAVAIAKQLGIATGTDGDQFAPQAKISRQDMMVMAARALVTAQAKDIKGDLKALDPFKDADNVSEYAASRVAGMIEQGLIQGDSGLINPSGHTTRAESAVFLSRLLKVLAE